MPGRPLLAFPGEFGQIFALLVVSLVEVAEILDVGRARFAMPVLRAADPWDGLTPICTVTSSTVKPFSLHKD